MTQSNPATYFFLLLLAKKMRHVGYNEPRCHGVDGDVPPSPLFSAGFGQTITLPSRENLKSIRHEH